MTTIQDLERRIASLESQLRAMPHRVLSTIEPSMRFYPLTVPLTSTAWDGDARSTEARTLLDLSAVFGAPPNVKAILVRMWARDSASAATTGLLLMLGPAGGSTHAALISRPSGLTDNYWAEAEGICPCDVNGDVYYQIVASGVGTLDANIQIWGYWL